MELSLRPTKRRRTKRARRLMEDDDEAAEGIAVHSVIEETDAGPVEKIFEEPIWTSRQPNTNPLSKNKDIQSDPTIRADDLPTLEQESEIPEFTERYSRTQNDYIEEFVGRIHPLLHAILSREAIPRNSVCARCPKLGRWRCRDCTLGRVLCRGCIRDRHMDSPLHRIEIWTGSCFRPAELWEVGVYMIIPHHTIPVICDTLKFQEGILSKFQQRRDDEEQLNWSVAEGSEAGRRTPSRCADYPIDNQNIGSNEDDTEEDRRVEELMDRLYQGGKGGSQSVDTTRLVDNLDLSADIDNDYDEDQDVSSLPAGYMPTIQPEPSAVQDNMPRSDVFNNPYIRIVHNNGLHNMAIVYCSCRGRDMTHSDLIAAGVVPTSFKRYRTVFTHAVLDDFRLSNLECKASAYQYYQKLRRQTSPMAPESVPNLYHELRRMSRVWRWMKKLKWAGVAHRPESAELEPGELANFCPTCPQPGVNLPDKWPDDPERYIITNITGPYFIHFLSHRWVYKRSLVADGNFKADHVRQKNPEKDVWLSEGGGMIAKREVYEEFLRNAIVISAVSQMFVMPRT